MIQEQNNILRLDLNKHLFACLEDHTVLLNLTKKHTIVDLGCCEGRFMCAIDERLEQNIEKYICVDPNPISTMTNLLPNIEHNSHNNYFFYNRAIHVQNNLKVNYYTIPHDKECNNIIGDQYFKHGTQPQEFLVNTITLEKIIEEQKIDIIDILKIDIEGYEFDLIESFTPELANKIHQITIEFHDFVNPNLRKRCEDARHILYELGFKLFYHRRSNGWHGSDYYDTLFINPNLPLY